MGRFPTEEELRDLYLKKKKSLSEMSGITGFKTHKVIYWMDKYGIARRERSVANYIKANPDGEPFKIKRSLTREEVKLKYLALGLYWGEGNKATNYKNRVTNSDPGVINIFRQYLHKICQVKDTRIHYYLQVFKDNDVVVAKEYWSRQLSINPDRIIVGNPIPSMGKGTYKKICEYGVMSIDFSNTHLKAYIKNELNKLGMK